MKYVSILDLDLQSLEARHNRAPAFHQVNQNGFANDSYKYCHTFICLEAKMINIQVSPRTYHIWQGQIHGLYPWTTQKCSLPVSVRYWLAARGGASKYRPA